MMKSGLIERLQIAELADQSFNNLLEKIKTFDSSDAVERHAFYNKVVLTVAHSMNDGDIEILAPFVEQKLGVLRAAFVRDIKKRRAEIATIEDKGTEKTGDRSARMPASWPDRPIHPALDSDPVSGFASVGLLRPEGYGILSYHPEAGAAWHRIESVAARTSTRTFPYPSLADRWPEDDLRRFLLAPASPTFAEAFALLVDLVRVHIELTREEHAALLASWIIGTYFHPAFPAFPRIHINGEPGSGKTKAQSIISSASFNGLLRTSPSLAGLFRIIAAHKPTICLDEMDNLGGDDRRELFALLNDGYKRGGAIDRVEGDKERHVESYPVYTPICLSGVKAVNRTTAERCLFVNMQKGVDRTRLNSDPSADEGAAARIRSLCYLLALTRQRDVQETFKKKEGPAWLNGRDLELWKPLLVVVGLVDVEAGLGAEGDLLNLARESVGDREGLTVESEALLAVLEELLGLGQSITVRPGTLCQKLDERLHPRFPSTPEGVAAILRRLGFRKVGRDREGVLYAVSAAKVSEVMVRYTPENPALPTCTGEPPHGND